MTIVITDASLEGGRPRIAGLLVQNGRVAWFAETIRSTATDIAVFETLARKLKRSSSSMAIVTLKTERVAHLVSSGKKNQTTQGCTYISRD